MKHYYLTAAALTWLVFSFTSCTPEEKVVEPVKLSSPSLVSEVLGENSFTVSWESVDNASSYLYEFNGEQTQTAETSVTFTDLETDASYTVKVKSVAAEGTDFIDSDWSETTVALEKDEEEVPDEVTFDITCDVVGRVVYVKVSPSDKEIAHYSEILSDADYQDYGGTPESAFREILNFYEEVFGTGTFDFLKDIGDIEYDMDMDAYDLQGYVFAAGIDKDLNITTEVAMEGFKTGPLPMSDNTFEIELVKIGPAEAEFYITPSNDDPYTMIVMEKDDLYGYTEDDIHSLFCKEYKAWINEHLYTGEMSMRYTTGLFPDTDYYLFIFGWDTEPNTEINKYEFKTEKAVDDTDITFEMYAEVQSYYEIYAKVTPSKNDVLYFFDVLPKADYEGIEDNIKDYYQELCDSYGFPLIDYINLFASIGEDEYMYDYMEPETEYIFYAVALTVEDDNVAFHTPQLYDEVLVTPAE